MMKKITVAICIGSYDFGDLVAKGKDTLSTDVRLELYYLLKSFDGF